MFYMAVPVLQHIILNVPGGKINSLLGLSIGNSKQTYICICVLFRTFSKITVLCTVQQKAMSSHDLQSACMLRVKFSKIYCTK
jgi:uncharacterized ion transporter superfamily protein YfcC